MGGGSQTQHFKLAYMCALARSRPVTSCLPTPPTRQRRRQPCHGGAPCLGACRRSAPATACAPRAPTPAAQGLVARPLPLYTATACAALPNRHVGRVIEGGGPLTWNLATAPAAAVAPAPASGPRHAHHTPPLPPPLPPLPPSLTTSSPSWCASLVICNGSAKQEPPLRRSVRSAQGRNLWGTAPNQRNGTGTGAGAGTVVVPVPVGHSHDGGGHPDSCDATQHRCDHGSRRPSATICRH